MDFNWKTIKLGKTDRGILIGATGSGKTTLARYLIEDEQKPYSVVYDAKISDAIGKWSTTQKIYTDFSEIQHAEEPRLIYRPSWEEEQNPNAQDSFFAWIYNRWRTRLYVDEAYALLGGTNPSRHLQACITRGRERGISTLIATQRPKRIPLITMSEAEHYYIFRTLMPEDRQRVFELTGLTVDEQIDLREYEFYYFHVLRGLHPHKLKLKL